MLIKGKGKFTTQNRPHHYEGPKSAGIQEGVRDGIQSMKVDHFLK